MIHAVTRLARAHCASRRPCDVIGTNACRQASEQIVRQNLQSPASVVTRLDCLLASSASGLFWPTCPFSLKASIFLMCDVYLLVRLNFATLPHRPPGCETCA